jgi:dihydrofolate reductase
VFNKAPRFIQEDAKMGTIVVSEYMTVDGVIEAPENWHFPYMTDESQADTARQINSFEVLLLGRKTYDAFAPVWPTMTNNEFGIADHLNNAPKYVVSTTMQTADWNNTTIISQDIVASIRKLKDSTTGKIGITGSATLVRTLVQAGLVDEFELMVDPIALGTGLRLFSEDSAPKLRLLENKAYSNGVLLLRYAPATAT